MSTVLLLPSEKEEEGNGEANKGDGKSRKTEMKSKKRAIKTENSRELHGWKVPSPKW